ncbi:MAG: DUF6789 family protein [Candidatus Limnocylindrales bacterium]
MTDRTRGTLGSAAIGSLAGIAAALVMSALMIAGKRAGLMPEHPPEEIARAALSIDGSAPDEELTEPLAAVLHLGFGAAMGAAFGVIHRFTQPIAPAAVQGVLFALGTWAVSYLGWVPALGIMPRADRDVPGRQPVMIAAHVVYGAVLGSIVGLDRGPARPGA